MVNKRSLEKKKLRWVFSECIGLLSVLVYLLLHNKFSPNLVALKNDIYFLIVSVGQESGRSLADSSGSGSPTSCNQCSCARWGCNVI